MVAATTEEERVVPIRRGMIPVGDGHNDGQ